MHLTRKLMSTKIMGQFIVKEMVPGPEVKTDKKLMESTRNISQTIYHPVGTCKMGSKLKV